MSDSLIRPYMAGRNGTVGLWSGDFGRWYPDPGQQHPAGTQL